MLRILSIRQNIVTLFVVMFIKYKECRLEIYGYQLYQIRISLYLQRFKSQTLSYVTLYKSSFIDKITITCLVYLFISYKPRFDHHDLAIFTNLLNQHFVPTTSKLAILSCCCSSPIGHNLTHGNSI